MDLCYSETRLATALRPAQDVEALASIAHIEPSDSLGTKPQTALSTGLHMIATLTLLTVAVTSTTGVVLAVVVALMGTGGLSWLVAAIRANTQNRLDGAKAEEVIVHTSRELIAELRTEMDRKVSDLTAEVGRIRGHLEAAVTERDHLREVERTLRIENASLRQRVDDLEARIDLLIAGTEAPGPEHQ